ncbi:uncharacterized protein LOC142345693 [Convolutriloba macropyga]|uniref:uncharacterized protein LOC142345693 n=1 Tax=Convolutriloba macropyga TaxID=536237 RepID=UPI003F51BCBF
MEDVSNALCLLVSHKVTERKKGSDNLRACLENKDIQLALSNGRNNYSQNNITQFSPLTWDSVFEDVRTYVSLELEKVESSMINGSSVTQRSSLSLTLNSTFGSSASARPAKQKNLSDVVALVRWVLDQGLGCENGISPHTVVSHICKFLQDDFAQSCLGNEYLAILSKHVLCNAECIKQVKRTQWASLTRTLFKENSNFTFGALIPVCKSFIKCVVDNCLHVDCQVINLFFKQQFSSASLVDKNWGLIGTVTDFAEFVFEGFGSVEIAVQVMLPVLPSIFGSLSRSSVSPLKHKMIPFLSIAARILIDLNDESLINEKESSLRGIYDCIVHSIEIDLQQCDPKLTVSRKFKIADKMPFFQLLQVVAGYILQVQPGEKQVGLSEQLVDEPARKRQKKELRLDSWEDYYSMFKDCNNEIVLSYVTEMLLVIFNGSVEVSANVICSLLEGTYFFLSCEDYGTEIRHRLIDLSSCLLLKINVASAFRTMSLVISRKFTSFCIEIFQSANFCSKICELLCSIVVDGKFEHDQQILGEILNFVESVFSPKMMSIEENSYHFLRLLIWGLERKLIDRYEKKLKTACWVNKNELMRNFINNMVKCVCRMSTELVLTKIPANEIRMIRSCCDDVLWLLLQYGQSCSSSCLNWEVMGLVKDCLSDVIGAGVKENTGNLKRELITFLVRLCFALSTMINLSIRNSISLERIVKKEDISGALRTAFKSLRSLIDVINSSNSQKSSESFNSLISVHFYDLVILLSKSEDTCLFVDSITNFVQDILYRQDSKHGRELQFWCLKFLIVCQDRFCSSQSCSESFEALFGYKMDMMEVLQELVHDAIFLQHLPDCILNDILLKLTGLCERNFKNPPVAEKLLTLSCLTVSESTRRNVANFDAMLIEVTLTAFWCLVRTSKLRDPRIVSSLVKLTNEVAQHKIDFDSVLLSDEFDSSQLGSLNSDDRTPVFELFADQLEFASKLVCEDCVKGLLLFANRSLFHFQTVTQYLIEVVEKLVSGNLKQKKCNQYQIIKRALKSYFMGVEINSKTVESVTIKHVSKLLQDNLFTVTDVENILNCYAGNFNLQRQAYFKAIISNLAQHFEADQLKQFRFFDAEAFSREVVSSSVVQSLIETRKLPIALESASNRSNIELINVVYPLIVKYLIDREDLTNDNVSALLKIDGKSIVTELNSKHAGHILYNFICDHEFHSAELKIKRYANYLQYENSEVEGNILVNCYDVQEKFLRRLKDCFSGRSIDIIDAFKNQLKFLKLLKGKLHGEDLGFYFGSLFCILRENLEIICYELFTTDQFLTLYSVLVQISSEIVNLQWNDLIYELPLMVQLLARLTERAKSVNVKSNKICEDLKDLFSALHCFPELSMFLDGGDLKNMISFCENFSSEEDFDTSGLLGSTSSGILNSEFVGKIDQYFSYGPKEEFFLKHFAAKLVNLVLANRAQMTDNELLLPLRKLWLKFKLITSDFEDINPVFSLISSQDFLVFMKVISVDDSQASLQRKDFLEGSDRVVLEGKMSDQHLALLSEKMLDFLNTSNLTLKRCILTGIQEIVTSIPEVVNKIKNVKKKILFEQCRNLSVHNKTHSASIDLQNVLTYAQQIMLDLVNNMSVEGLQFLVPIIEADVACALKLFPLLITMSTSEMRSQLGVKFSDEFKNFLRHKRSDVNLDVNTEAQIVPLFNCVLDLMNFQKTASNTLSYLHWLEIDFDLLSKVASKLGYHMISIFFAEYSIMSRFKSLATFGSAIPIDEHCDYSEQIIQSAIKVSCQDTAVGCGLERSDSANLQLIAYQNSTENGDLNKVSQLLNLLPSFLDRTSGERHLNALIEGSPLKQVSLPAYRQCAEPKFSNDLKDFNFAEILADSPSYGFQSSVSDLANWQQLSFLNNENSFELSFNSIMCQMKDPKFPKIADVHIETCYDSFSKEIKDSSLNKSKVLSVVKKFEILNSLCNSKDFQLTERWDCFSLKDGKSLFQIQNTALSRLASLMDLDSEKTRKILASQSKLVKDYVTHLVANENLCAAAALLNDSNSFDAAEKVLINAKINWKRKNFSRAKFAILNQLKEAGLIFSVKAELQFQLAKFNAESCSESTETITGLIESAKENFTEAENCERELKSCHLTLAKFADEQYEKSDRFIKSQDFQKVAERIKTVQRELDLIRESDQHKTSYYHKLNLRQESDRHEQEKVLKQREAFLFKAVESYFYCVMKGSELDKNQDLSVLRIVALWFQNYTNLELNQLIEDQFEESSVDCFVQVLPQLIGRLAGSENTNRNLTVFESLLQKVVIAVCQKHFYHGIYNLLAVTNSAKEVKNFSDYVKYTVDSQRVNRVNEIIEKLRQYKAPELKAVETLVDAYIYAAYLDKGKYANKHIEADFKRSDRIMKIEHLQKVPVPTMELPIERDGNYSKFPNILKFQKKFQVLGGINAPKVVKLLTSDGRELRQIVKGNDDLRQDAVMQQVFGLCNRLLTQNSDAMKRCLNVATYKVVPLAPSSGILQWCENTTTLADYLIGNSRHPKKGAHYRFRPNDMKLSECHDKLIECRKNPKRTDSDFMRIFTEICNAYQPVFHLFFVETFPNPSVWFEKRLNYTRSVAVSSIVGYILGLGDRHISNILLNVATAEVVHIDLGMAFEQGKEIAVPETVPFRLTRDLVSAFGVSGVEGSFRRGCELTMEAMREHRNVITTIIQVLVHDPLLNWTLSPAKALMLQESEKIERENNNNCQDSDKHLGIINQSENWKKNQSALRVIDRLQSKLTGMDGGSGVDLLSVEGHVSWLIREATDFRNLSKLFHGWRAWV